MPLVSVVMSVFEDQAYVEEAITSILEQKFRDFEFLIIDDCGKDETSVIIQRYAAKDPRITILRNEENIGLTRSLNKGFTFASGKYLARMDADDVSQPERLQQQVDYLERHPKVGVLGTFHRYSNEDNVRISPVDHEAIVARLLFMNVFCHPSVMLRKEVIDTHQLFYNESFYFSQDYELWVRAMVVTQLAVLPVNLVTYRIHTGQISTRKRTLQRQLLQRVWGEYFQLMGSMPKKNSLETHEKLINRHPIKVSLFFQLIGTYKTLIRNANVKNQGALKKEIRSTLGNYTDQVSMRWAKRRVFKIFARWI